MFEHVCDDHKCIERRWSELRACAWAMAASFGFVKVQSLPELQWLQFYVGEKGGQYRGTIHAHKWMKWTRRRFGLNKQTISTCFWTPKSPAKRKHQPFIATNILLSYSNFTTDWAQNSGPSTHKSPSNGPLRSKVEINWRNWLFLLSYKTMCVRVTHAFLFGKKAAGNVKRFCHCLLDKKHVYLEYGAYAGSIPGAGYFKTELSRTKCSAGCNKGGKSPREAKMYHFNSKFWIWIIELFLSKLLVIFIRAWELFQSFGLFPACETLRNIPSFTTSVFTTSPYDCESHRRRFFGATIARACLINNQEVHDPIYLWEKGDTQSIHRRTDESSRCQIHPWPWRSIFGKSSCFYFSVEEVLLKVADCHLYKIISMHRHFHFEYLTIEGFRKLRRTTRRKSPLPLPPPPPQSKFSKNT